MTTPAALSDIDDPRFDDYRDLRTLASRSNQLRLPAVIAEGPLAVERLLASPYPVRSVLVTPQRLETLGPVPDDVPVYTATHDVLEAVCGFRFHRGVIAAASRLPVPDASTLLTAQRVGILEGVGDAENLGAIFRTAAALGLGALLLDDRCGDPLYRRVVRVSMGWSLHVPWARIPTVADAIGTVCAAGYRSIALTPRSDAIAVDAAAESGLLDGPVALLVGAEGAGLTAAAIDAADHSVRIPMTSDVDSLNVATALGVAASFVAARAGWPGTDI